MLHAADWEKLPSLPEPNGGFICGVVAGHVLVIGGTNWEGGEKHWLKNSHRFNPETKTWSEYAFREPVAYAVTGGFPGGASAESGFIFAGGFTGKGGFPWQVQVNPAEWHKVDIGQPPNQIAALAAGGMLGKRLVICGGTDDPANLAGLRRNTYALERTGRVEFLPDYPGKPFGTAASAVAGKELFIFGGANWTGEAQLVSNTDDAYAFSTATKQWRKLRSFPYAVRGLTAATLDSNRLYLAGGYKGDAEGFTDEAFIYDIAKDTYTPAKPLPYKAMVALVKCGDFLYCLGGEDKQKSRTDACFRIPLASLLK